MRSGIGSAQERQGLASPTGKGAEQGAEAPASRSVIPA